MICQKCQAAEATVHTTTIVNGSSTESHLCAKCGDGSAVLDFQGLLKKMLGPVGLAQLLNIPGMPSMSAQPPGALGRKCPKCGITLGDIQKTGKLGCPEDYSVFGNALSQMIAAAQGGGTRHVGKTPLKATVETRRAVLQSKVDDLQRRMDGAAFREDYVRAAACRDEIKDTQAELSRLSEPTPPKESS